MANFGRNSRREHSKLRTLATACGIIAVATAAIQGASAVPVPNLIDGQAPDLLVPDADASLITPDSNQQLPEVDHPDRTVPLRISAGVNGDIDPNMVPRGNIFSGYDVRASQDGTGTVLGFQSQTAWNNPEADMAAKGIVTPTSAGYTLQMRSGTIASDEDNSKAIQFSAGLNGAFFGNAAKVSASFGYDTTKTSTSHQVSGYTYASAALPGAMLTRLDMLELSDEALAYLTTDIDQFFNIFGTHFIKTKVYGCEASAAYSFSCATSTAKEDIRAALQANYNSGLNSVGASVQTKFSTYASSGVCTYSGQTTATGLNVVSPSQAQMMDSTFMDAYWNKFSDSCQANAAQRGQLLYVELGNWLEVPAVQLAVAQNATAKATLAFFNQLQTTDVMALAYGSVYQYKANSAYRSMRSEYMDPVFQTGMIDRNGRAVASNNMAQYWASLPQKHQAFGAAAAAVDFSNYFGSAALQSAIASGTTTAKAVALRYFQDSQALYFKAVDAYQYVYSGVQAVASGFQRDDKTPVVSVVSLPADRKACPTSDPTQERMCANGEVGVGTASPMHFALSIHRDTAYAPNLRMLAGEASFDSAKAFLSTENQPRLGVLDFTPWVHNMCVSPSCPPARVEFSTLFVMPDIDFSANPYAM